MNVNSSNADTKKNYDTIEALKYILLHCNSTYIPTSDMKNKYNKRGNKMNLL